MNTTAAAAGSTSQLRLTSDIKEQPRMSVTITPAYQITFTEKKAA